jgi:hypothetical protein
MIEVRDLNNNLLIECRNLSILRKYGFIKSHKDNDFYFDKPIKINKIEETVIIKELDTVWQRKQKIVFYTQNKKE